MLRKAALLVFSVSLVIGQECQSKPADVVYVVDASGSVGATNFNKTLAAIKNVVQGFDIGPSTQQTHVGFVSFDSQGYYNFGLGNYTTETPLLAAIEAVPYTGGGTNIYSGMMLALNQVFGQAGDRATVADIMIVVTDGQDNSSVSVAQQLAESRGITVWAVGVGNEVSYNQLIAIAGTPTRIRNTTSFDFLQQQLEDIPCPTPSSPSQTCEDPGRACNRSECLDLYAECAGWAKQGLCKANPERALTMEKICPVSCGYCEEICEDYACPDECAARAQAGDCRTDPEYMLVRCKKSCQYCGDKCVNLHAGCPWVLAAGQCTTNATAYFYCPFSCGACTPVSNCTTLDPIAHKCPRDWAYSPITNKCYWATSSLQNYATNKATCTSVSATLVSIHNITQNDMFTNFLPIPPSPQWMLYHIGLYRGANWGIRYWEDGSPADYVRWDAGQPNGGTNEVVAGIILNSGTSGFTKGFWHDVIYATEYYPAFCQKEVCPVTTTTTTTTMTTTTTTIA